MVGSSALNQNSCLVLIYTYAQMHMRHLCIHVDIYKHVFIYWLFKNPLIGISGFAIQLAKKHASHCLTHLCVVSGTYTEWRDLPSLSETHRQWVLCFALLELCNREDGVWHLHRRAVRSSKTRWSNADQSELKILHLGDCVWQVTRRSSGDCFPSVLGDRTVLLSLFLSLVCGALLTWSLKQPRLPPPPQGR